MRGPFGLLRVEPECNSIFCLMEFSSRGVVVVVVLFRNIDLSMSVLRQKQETKPPFPSLSRTRGSLSPTLCPDPLWLLTQDSVVSL